MKTIWPTSGILFASMTRSDTTDDDGCWHDDIYVEDTGFDEQDTGFDERVEAWPDDEHLDAETLPSWAVSSPETRPELPTAHAVTHMGASASITNYRNTVVLTQAAEAGAHSRNGVELPAAAQSLAVSSPETRTEMPAVHAVTDMGASASITSNANTGVLTQVALAEAEATWARQRNEHACRQHAATPCPRDDRANFRHGGASHPAVRPTLLMPPRTWVPAVHDVLLVTRVWQNVVWVWNESQDHSHRGVGLLTAQWLLGDVPHFLPAGDKHIHICQLLPDDSDLPVVQMSSMPPRGWPGGRGMWLVRWLEGM